MSDGDREQCTEVERDAQNEQMARDGALYEAGYFKAKADADQALAALKAEHQHLQQQFDRLANAVAPFRHTPEDRCLWEHEDGTVSVDALVSAAVNHRESTPESWANQDEDSAVVTAIAAVVREADGVFMKVGGGSRHWLRDCFLPVLNRQGWQIVRADESREAIRAEIQQLRASQAAIQQGLEQIRKLIATVLVDREYKHATRWRQQFLDHDDERLGPLPNLSQQLVCFLIVDAMTLREVDEKFSTLLQSQTPASPETP